MASPNATFTELVSTTLRKHRKSFVDNVSNNNALLSYIMKRGNYETVDGGLTLVEPLDYAANGTYQRFSGYDTLNISPSDVLTSAEFAWKQIAIHVIASGQEIRMNSGASQIISLAKSRIKNARRTWNNNFSYDIYSDGTLPNQIGGIQLLISDAGTGTVGGIDSSAWPFWLSQVQSAAAPLNGGGAVTVGATTIEQFFNDLWLALVRGDDKPDLIVCDNNYYSFYEASQIAIKRYTNDSGLATGGFTSLRYKTANVIFDGGSGIPDNHAYFQNTDYIKMRVHQDANMTMVDEQRPVNQDSSITPMIWMGNMTISNRHLQGVAKA